MAFISTTAKAEHQMDGRVAPNIIVGQGAVAFQLRAGKDEALLSWATSILLIDFHLDVIDGIRALDIKSDWISISM
jgi:hypothetical protein